MANKRNKNTIRNGRGYNYTTPGRTPGVGPGPSTALGRPADLPGDHGSWKNDSGFARGSKGWKPDILTLGDAHTCPGRSGPLSPYRPPNVSGDPSGYNTEAFPDEESIAKALQYIGYHNNDGALMLRRFQRHWNSVISRLAYSPSSYSDLHFSIMPIGNLQIDGQLGPNVLNAIEVAMVNQRLGQPGPWPDVVKSVSDTTPGTGREMVYNAAEGE